MMILGAGKGFPIFLRRFKYENRAICLLEKLSIEELDSFVRNGFLVCRGAIPERELVDVDRDSMELIDKGKDGPFGDERWRYGKDEVFNKHSCLYRVNRLDDADMPESFSILLAYPPLLRTVHSLVKGDAFAASVHALVFKLPEHGFPALWHQDPVKVFHFPVFNMDIYLDDSTRKNGCLWVIPGSHLAGYHDSKKTTQFIPSWTRGLHETAPGAVPVEVSRGDVIFHATTLIHGSFWNRSSDLRRTVYYHFDHAHDVALAGQSWPQNQFKEACFSTSLAVKKRANRYPNEVAFPYADSLKGS